MALSINRQLFHTEIFPKIKYDKTIGMYRIDVSDYALLKLRKRQLRVLANICKENNIYLETVPGLISIKETQKLFLKLNQLKKENTSNPEIQNEIFKIRTKLFEAHQILIYRIIGYCIPNYDKSPDKEDIIQIGYECLLHAIDNYDYQKGESFRWYLHTYISSHIMRQISYMNKDLYSNKDLLKMINSRAKLLEENIDITIEKLSEESGLKIERIKELLSLEQILNADSYEYLQELDSNMYLTEGTYKEEIFFKIYKEFLMSIIDTLPNEQQKQVIILSYGLNGVEPKKFSEIANILGLTRQRIEQLRDEAIANLKNPIRSKYIKEITEGYTEIDIPLDEEIPDLDENNLLYERFEQYLSKFLDKEFLLSGIMKLDPKYKEILFHYFELYNEEDKPQIGMSIATYIAKRRKGLIQLRKILTAEYKKFYSSEDLQTFLDCLMHNYLNQNKPYTRKRNKK